MSNYKFNGSSVSTKFTTTYEYGSADKEYVFCCKGRPFAALVSPNLPTPSSSLLDYDLIKKLGLKMVDIQCRKFYFRGHKMRILGQVSTAVQCVQGGRISGNFHVKGLVISDLYQKLDTHCVAGVKMRERITSLTGEASDEQEEEEDFSDDKLNTSLEGDSPAMMSGSSPVVMPCSSAPSVTMKPCLSAPSVTRTPSASASSVATMTSSLAPSAASMISSSSVGKLRGRLPKPFTTPRPVGTTWPNTATELKVPDLPNLLSSKRDNCLRWLDRCEGWEGETLKQSYNDNQPRVIYLDGDDDTMLRVGDWGGLADPHEHQIRHVHLAQNRRDSDRECHYCSYFLGHTCDLYYPAITHCKECCVKMQHQRRSEDSRWGQRGGQER